MNRQVWIFWGFSSTNRPGKIAGCSFLKKTARNLDEWIPVSDAFLKASPGSNMAFWRGNRYLCEQFSGGLSSYPCALKVEHENQPLICSKEKLQLHFADAQRHPASELTEQGSPNSFTEGLQSLKTNERLETKKLDHQEAAPGQCVMII